MVLVGLDFEVAQVFNRCETRLAMLPVQVENLHPRSRL
jgi:hypothetical protein